MVKESEGASGANRAARRKKDTVAKTGSGQFDWPPVHRRIDLGTPSLGHRWPDWFGHLCTPSIIKILAAGATAAPRGIRDTPTPYSVPALERSWSSPDPGIDQDL